MLPEFAPFLPLVLGAALALLPFPRLRAAALLAAPLLGLYGVLTWPRGDGEVWLATLAGVELTLCRVDGLAAFAAGLFCLAAFLSGLFSLHVRDRLQAPAGLLYAGSAVGMMVAGDYLTLFLWVEVMALASVALIWARGTPAAVAAGWRYLLWQLGSGLLLLAGALLRQAATGSAAIGPMGLDEPGAWFLFLAFGTKAAFPLLHVWLKDAYPEATATGTVWLSAFTTKAAVFLFVRCFPGAEPLIWLGVAMTCFPIFFAVIENDLRRVLSYSLINQVGFMLCGVGIGTPLALAGTVAHAFCHVIYKSLLLMSMGSVLQQTGRIGANQLGGLWRSMPRTAVCCIVGAASISAVPLFSGFVSKAMVLTAAAQECPPLVWILLVVASAGVLEHSGIKVPYFAFFAHDSGLRPAEPPRNMQAAMGLAALLCVGIGCAPGLLYQLVPFPFEYHPYDLSHVVAQLQLLSFAALAIIWLHRSGLYPREIPAVNLDADWLLRRVAPAVGGRIAAVAGPVLYALRRAGRHTGERLWRTLMRHHGPQGRLSHNWPTESMMLWTALLLGALLVLYYL